jgi:hypothetical protein
MYPTPLIRIPIIKRIIRGRENKMTNTKTKGIETIKTNSLIIMLGGMRILQIRVKLIIPNQN